MVQTQMSRYTRTALAIIIPTILLSLSPACAAQAPAYSSAPRANPAPAQTANTAPPQSTNPAPAPRPVSSMLQPALDTVHQTLASMRMDRWKKGSVRDEAGTNIDSIQNDLRTNLPPLLQQADSGPGTISKLLPVSRHLDALYNVLLRVVEASRIAAPDDQAAQLQKALLSLGDARLALGDRLQGSADALEKQVVDLRATIERQAAQRQIVPAPVALPCIPPPTKKPATRTHRPAAKPAPKPGTTTTTPNKTQGTKTNQPSTNGH